MNRSDSIDLDLLGLLEYYSRLLLERDRRLSFALENVLREVARADASDRGIDLAVGNVWSGYRPGPRKWEPLPYPNSHWLTCETAATGDGRCSQKVHLNLLNGTLLVDCKPIDGLPREIREQKTYKRIFGDVRMITSFHFQLLIVPCSKYSYLYRQTSQEWMSALWQRSLSTE